MVYFNEGITKRVVEDLLAGPKVKHRNKYLTSGPGLCHRTSPPPAELSGEWGLPETSWPVQPGGCQGGGGGREFRSGQPRLPGGSPCSADCLPDGEHSRGGGLGSCEGHPADCLGLPADSRLPGSGTHILVQVHLDTWMQVAEDLPDLPMYLLAESTNTCDYCDEEEDVVVKVTKSVSYCLWHSALSRESGMWCMKLGQLWPSSPQHVRSMELGRFPVYRWHHWSTQSDQSGEGNISGLLLALNGTWKYNFLNDPWSGYQVIHVVWNLNLIGHNFRINYFLTALGETLHFCSFFLFTLIYLYIDTWHIWHQIFPRKEIWYIKMVTNNKYSINISSDGVGHKLWQS